MYNYFSNTLYQTTQRIPKCSCTIFKSHLLKMLKLIIFNEQLFYYNNVILKLYKLKHVHILVNFVNWD